MKIVIAGLGLMGGSLALALSRQKNKHRIFGWDFPQILDKAVKNGVVGHAVENWPQDCAGADIVFLATPVSVIKQQLRELNGVVDRSTVVSDLGSTKSEVLAEVERIEFTGTFVGGHPLAGSEKSGLQAADALLMENAIYVLCNATLDTPPLPQKLVRLLESLKARLLHLPAVEHDRIVAYISHLPQIISVALMNVVGGKNESNPLFVKMAAGGFRDLTRIASSPYSMWKDIVDSNTENISTAVKEFSKQLDQLARQQAELEKGFNRANRYRSEIPRNHKGFISPLIDVLVKVRDEVGVIAKISNALFNEAVDIRDIELIKMREGEGGIFRLSFASEHDAEKAVDILNSLNFEAYIR